MNGWVIAIIIILILGIIISNLMLLKQTANMKLPESVLRSIKERQDKALKQEKPKDQ